MAERQTPLLPRTAEGLATFYNMMHGKTEKKPNGFDLAAHMNVPVCALMDKRIKNLLCIVGPGSGKALDPDTKVLTPTGWVPIRFLKIGDSVITPDGRTPAVVRGVFWQAPSYLYKLKFADGREVISNKDHLWKAYTKKFAKRGEPMKWRLRTTEELAAYLWHARVNKWYVPLCSAVEQVHADLPIDPYVMGAVLGDGHISNIGSVSFTSADEGIVDRVRQTMSVEGLEVIKGEGKYHYGVRGLGKRLVILGLALKRSWEKFVPDIYKKASVEQRWSLLQGLMDTDGYVDVQKSTSFCSTSKQLAIDVQDIVRSLGGIAVIAEKRTSFTHKGEKKQGRLAYNVHIRHPDPQRLFHLQRKKERAQKTQYSDDLKLEIVEITREPIERESVCINIDHPDGLFIVENYVVTHNSLLFDVTYPAFEIGHDPTETILGISAGESLVQGFQRGVAEWIEFDETYHKIFPGVLPDKVAGWSTDRGLYVTGHIPGNPDSNYFTCGLTSSALTGKHAGVILGDDLHNKENSAGTDQCMKVRSDYHQTILGRQNPAGCRKIFTGRRWHPEDIYGFLKTTGEYVVLELPAVREKSNELYWTVTVPDGLECCFTDGSMQNVEQFVDTRV